ncbi:helix-turn-helix domain-containing protein [Sporomusa acidovorans]|uniref:HTH cro/C1-type domain-containing protein n=1 Tax=Sporomusa acidovorans (strain ATCC 49682 / DSM 3132 / Mol) TaxID=1123286 RepID=A0ABZ3J965_SPOA4|nr:helix-turn-helix domain-containing protein [Sporomusa acidovorans]OZC16051.1 hypothetical protein SPACI_44170 [Sporomusa acidovorans DSM 3132]SDD88261.1 hypothetical protein SAMN04488499_100580 [Sporomusa acidovorans]
MHDFSEIVKKELKLQGISIQDFAGKLGFSLQYTYNLINRKGNKRWNEDSIQKACEVLRLEIKFASKGV